MAINNLLNKISIVLSIISLLLFFAFIFFYLKLGLAHLESIFYKMTHKDFSCSQNKKLGLILISAANH
jgi:hypothetical protein